jgi:CopG antitoxin of type II toxin-antitoxin system
MNKPEEEFTLQLHPRQHETVSLEIPKDTLESLKKIADSRDMSYEALLKFYIGQGLRQDVAKLSEKGRRQRAEGGISIEGDK